jgi:hypothetical protein
MKVIVYFESSAHAEVVAQFSDESLYMACLPALEAKAKELRMIVTESIEEDV